jgi:hypothetical protein
LLLTTINTLAVKACPGVSKRHINERSQGLVLNCLGELGLNRRGVAVLADTGFVGVLSILAVYACPKVGVLSG